MCASRSFTPHPSPAMVTRTLSRFTLAACAASVFATALVAQAPTFEVTVEHGLASLETALVDWVHGHLDDDIALVLLEYAGADDKASVPMPSWEVGAAGS